MIKISGMLHDSKEIFVNKKQKQQKKTKTKKQRKHPTYNNKLTKVSVWKKIYLTLGIWVHFR